jgi:FG-GAP-like repeat/Pentapeptide repeats (8 copies)/HYR domain
MYRVTITRAFLASAAHNRGTSRVRLPHRGLLAVALGFACLGMPAAAGASIGLAPPIRIPAETFPMGAAAADLNGDGRADAVSLEANSSHAAVRLSLGGGSFAAPQFFNTVLYPDTVALRDMNGDDRADLVVSSALVSFISVSLGNGDGTFSDPIMSFIPGGGGRFAIGDFNGDGRLDVAMNQLIPQSIAILLGQGDGRLTLASTYAIGNSSFAVCAADFDNDGKLDLAVGTYDGPVVILRGNGDGTFVEVSRFTTPGQVRGVAAADVNSDGRQDLVTAFASSSTPAAASVFLGAGDGTFGQPHDLYGDGIVGQAYDVAIGDLDRDGNPDIVLASNGAGVFQGNGDGTFTGPEAIGQGGVFDRIAIADFDGNGRPDVMLSEYGANELWFALNPSPADTTPPVIAAPGLVTAKATTPSGATVTYSVSVTDPDDAASTPACSPASGSFFPLGVTTVNCTSSDTHGNTGSASFQVDVTALGADCTLGDYPLIKGTTNLNLKGANLSGCYLVGVNLAKAVASNANLKAADLKDANLSGADLSQANLAGAILSGANLTGANLSGTTLAGANMTGATVTGVIWLQTTCPDGTTSNTDGGTCAGHLG